MEEPVISVWEDLFIYCYPNELEEFIDLYGKPDIVQPHSEFYEREDIYNYVE
jgi:hypothetical protein